MNVNTKMAGPVLGVVALACAAYAPVGHGAAEKITVMNPAIAGKFAERIPLTPRLDTLEGKTVYLIDIQWGGPDGGYSVLEEMQTWFAENMPSVKTVLRRTRENMFTDDPGLWQEIADGGDAAIVGIAQ